jgi:hypothetical protein
MTATERILGGWGVPQWKLLYALPVGKRVVLKPGEILRIGRKGDGTWKYSAARSSVLFRLVLDATGHAGAGNTQSVWLSSRNEVIGDIGS